MNLYKKYILPWFLNREMGDPGFNETRAKVAREAQGTVLEIGFGPGYNLPFYQNVERLFALEPSQEIYKYAKKRIKSVTFPVEYLPNSAEEIPLPDGSVDSVVSTWTLCSIPNVGEALREIYRVLKPGRKFIFVEHGKSPKSFHTFLQHILTPITKQFTGNCHLNRDIEYLIKETGFILEKIEKYPEAGKPLMFSYNGIALKE